MQLRKPETVLYVCAAGVLAGLFLLVLSVVDRPHPAESRYRARKRINRTRRAGAIVTVLGVAGLIASLAAG